MAGVCFCEKMTLSTDLEHGVISDMAAVLWQAAEATAPVRSSGQMAVCYCPGSERGCDVFYRAQRQFYSLSRSLKSNTEVFFSHLNNSLQRKAEGLNIEILLLWISYQGCDISTSPHTPDRHDESIIQQLLLFRQNMSFPVAYRNQFYFGRPCVAFAQEQMLKIKLRSFPTVRFL